MRCKTPATWKTRKIISDWPDFDRTHRLVISYNYDLPFARWAGIENRGFGKLAHGWSLNGVTTFQSGTPFNIYDTSALTLQDPDGNNGFTRATLAPGKTLNDVLTSGDVKSRLDAYVNFSAFLAGGNCVNAQNQIVAASNAACTGPEGDWKRQPEPLPRAIPTELGSLAD